MDSRSSSRILPDFPRRGMIRTKTAKGEDGMDHEKTGRYIAACRKKKKMTQKDLADRLGVTNKAVSKWETGVSHS